MVVLIKILLVISGSVKKKTETTPPPAQFRSKAPSEQAHANSAY